MADLIKPDQVYQVWVAVAGTVKPVVAQTQDRAIQAFKNIYGFAPDAVAPAFYAPLDPKKKLILT